MSTIHRLAEIERSLREIQREKSRIPVLIVRENPIGTFTANFKGEVLTMNEQQLHEFAKEHDTKTIIVNNLPRTKGEE